MISDLCVLVVNNFHILLLWQMIRAVLGRHLKGLTYMHRHL